MKNLLNLLFVAMLIMSISSRASFLKKLNKEISSKQIKSLAQSKWNLDYGPLFPNTNQWENPFEYADSTAELDATSCSSIHWKEDPESDMECGLQDGVKKYCETIDKPFCHYLPDADNTGFGQCGTHSQVPYHTAKLIKQFSRFTMPKQCYCPNQNKQAGVDLNASVSCGKAGQTISFCVETLPHCVNTSTDALVTTLECQANANGDDATKNFTHFDFGHFPATCDWWHAKENKTEYEYYTREDLYDTASWRNRLASIYRIQSTECGNFYLNIMRKDDRCGRIVDIADNVQKNYFCSGYDHKVYLENTELCQGVNPSSSCVDPEPEKFCVPDVASSDVNACNNQACKCLHEQPADHSTTYVNTFDYDSISAPCQPHTDYLIQYSKVRLWDNYIQKIEQGNKILREEQDRFDKTNCPFVRVIVKKELPSEKPGLCEESHQLTQQMVTEAEITWLEIIGQSVIVFNEQAAKVAAAATCVFSFNQVNTDPTTLKQNFAANHPAFQNIQIQADCIETSIRSAICTTMGTEIKNKLDATISTLLNKLAEGITYAPSQCYDTIGLWPSSDYWTELYNTNELKDNDKASINEEFPNTIGWLFDPASTHTGSNTYSQIGAGYQLPAGAGNNNYLINELDESLSHIDMSGLNYGSDGRSGACMCPDGSITFVAEAHSNTCGTGRGPHDTAAGQVIWDLQAGVDGGVTENTAYKFWRNVNRIGCFNGGHDVYGRGSRADGKTLEQLTPSQQSDLAAGMCLTQPFYANKVTYCDNSRPNGYQQCGASTFNGKTTELHCPIEGQKCCTNLGGYRANAAINTANGDADNRCSFDCTPNNVYTNADNETFNGSDFVDRFHAKAVEILNMAKANDQSPWDYYLAHYKVPRTNGADLFFNEDNFCNESFNKNENRELFKHVFTTTLPWVMFKDVMNHCSQEGNDAECYPSTGDMSKLAVKRVAMDSFVTDAGNNKHYFTKYHDLQMVCQNLKTKFTTCSDAQLTTITNKDGTVHPILKVTNDPTAYHPVHKDVWIRLNCDHLPVESDAIDVPGFRNHCNNKRWEEAQKGAYNVFLEKIIDALRREHSLNYDAFIAEQHVIQIKNQAMSQYCSNFANQIYTELLDVTTTSATNPKPFKPSQMSNFVDFCQAKCMHYANTGVFYSVDSSNAALVSQRRVLEVKLDLFSPLVRNVHLQDWAPVSQQQTYWTQFPSYRRRKVAIKMGIRIREYLTKLQGRVMDFTEPATCTLEAGVVHAETKKYDCFHKENGTYYDKLPAYRHEFPVVSNDTGFTACSGTSRETRCDCQPPTDLSCSSAQTDADVQTCNLNNWNTQVKPYYQCLMRTRLETVQKVWIWMNHAYFNTFKNHNVTVHNRIPAMLRKEMGEKYCQEFCFGFALDHTKHTEDSNQWRETTCVSLCMMSFARTHNVKKMMNNDWFQFEDDNNLAYKLPDFVAHPIPDHFTSSDMKMYWYGNQHLWSKDTNYWVNNFKDLLGFCKHRYERQNLITALNDSDIKAKCNALEVATEDAEDANKVKCKFIDADSMPVERVCASWSAPHCVDDPDVSGQSICSKVANVADGSNCTGCEDNLSIPNLWGSDSDLENCFPAVAMDINAPSQSFVNECRQRYFLSNMNWPNEFWLKKENKDDQSYVFPKAFYDLIGPLDEPWTNPARSWTIGVVPETGDNYYHTSTCPVHNDCWLDNEAGTLADGEMNKHRTFVSQDDFAAAKPYNAEGNFVCKYVKTGVFASANEDTEKVAIADYYHELEVNCRPFEDIEIKAYDENDTADHYTMLPFPSYSATDNDAYVPAALAE